MLNGYKYFIKTYGCQANEYDSELIAGILEKFGASPVDNEIDADIVIFNTCAVRKNAEDKFYGRLGALKKIKNEKKDMIVIVTGCLAQKDYLKISNIDHVDIVLGTHRISQLPTILQELKYNKNKKIVDVDFTGRTEPDIPPRRLSKFSAYVPIMFGCDYYCTFCIVPFTRGKMQSRPKEQIIKEIQDLAQKGYKEIILLGQTVNAYGIDLKNSYDFADLLYDVSLIDGIKWIRFTSPYPTNFNDKQIKTICTINKIAKHVHLPLQSGNNEILRRMARKYTVEKFLEVVYKFRELCPNIALSTDIIVGFPYETDEQFQDTLNIVKQVRFDQAFMFAYSEREGTKAATYPQLPLKERLKRLYELISVQNEITIEKNREYVGKEVEILVEGETDKNPNKLEGRTETNKIVVFDKTEKDLVGKFVKVRITKSYLWGLEGILLNSD